VISQPRLGPTVGEQSGIGDTTFTAFLSPSQPKGLIWGVGPVFQSPTHKSKELGNDNWGGGASFVVLKMEKGSPWGLRRAGEQRLTLTDDQDGGSYNTGLIQPFINCNFKGGAYLTSAPVITVDWKAERGYVDRPDRRRRRQDLPLRQAAGELADRCVLQRGEARVRRGLADPLSGTADVSEVDGEVFASFKCSRDIRTPRQRSRG
jgi:hypothetical protein